MSLSWLEIVTAFGGGLFGAALGALPAFIFTGFVVLAGAAASLGGASVDLVGTVAFGPVLGPHVAFGGGVAAAAYAARKEKIANGKDITSAMGGLGDPMVLLVGGVFGIIGCLINKGIIALLGSHCYTDTVALSVVLSAIIVRLAFGRSGLFGTLTPEAQERGRWTPGGDQVWVPWQQDWLQAGTIGLGAGLASAWIYLAVAEAAPELAGVGCVIGFGLSAASLIFLEHGVQVPVTHHMTLIAAVAASVTGSLIIGALFGVLAALVGEFASRLMQIHGDTHIDPPANAIWFMTAVVLILDVLGIM